MKKALLLSVTLVLVALSACDKTDLSGVESRLNKLENEYASLSDAVKALQSAKEQGDYITSVVPVIQASTVVGYTIKFKNADPITIYNGTDGQDGADGKDGKDGKDATSNVEISYTSSAVIFKFSDSTTIQIPYSTTDFIKSIISVTFVPEYYDGLPTMFYGKSDKRSSLRYVISPSSVAGILTKDKVKINSIYTMTRSSIEITPLAITAFSADASTGVVDITIDGSALSSEYYSGQVYSSISLQISDGNATYNTDYIRLVAKNEGSGPDTPEPPTSSSVLSDGGKANCYLAPAGKSYSFYALTKGNGSESVGTPAKAELLWETKCGAEAIEKNSVVKDVVFDAGYVYFTAVADGNAVLAVKDAAGAILWSWHIWVTDYTPESEYDTWCSGVKMMNRNLGALSNDPEDGSQTFGLLYQWGRKDPFVGAASKTGITQATTYPPYVTTYVATDRTIGTVSYAVSNPTVFIKNESKDGGSWQSTLSDKLWGSQKTQYDPCPSGWKVPDKSAWTGWPNSSSSNSQMHKAFDSACYGWVMGSSYSVPDTWYPITEYRDGETGLIVYIESGHRYIKYWTTSFENTGHCAYSMEYWDSGYGHSNYICYVRTLAYISDAADGYGVRCQKEK